MINMDKASHMIRLLIWLISHITLNSKTEVYRKVTAEDARQAKASATLLPFQMASTIKAKVLFKTPKSWG
jgi:hypothetical protein